MSTAVAEPAKPQGAASHALKAFSDLPDLPVAEAKVESVVEVPKEKNLLGELDKAVAAEPEVKPGRKTSEQWKEVNADREQLRSKLAAIEAERDQLRNATKDLDTYKSEAQRAKDLEARLELTAYERSDKFQREFVDARKSLIEDARALAAELDLPADLVDRAIGASSKERAKLLDESIDSAATLSAVQAALREIDGLEKRKTQELTAYKGKLEAMTAQERRLAAEQHDSEKAQVMSAFDSNLPKIAQKLPNFFSRKEGDDVHNRAVEDNIAYARSIITGEASLEDQVTAPYLAVAARAAFAKVDAQAKELKAVKDRLAEYESNEGKLGSGGGEDRSAGLTSDGKPKGITQITSESFRF
jgi:hypothetical protein